MRVPARAIGQEGPNGLDVLEVGIGDGEEARRSSWGLDSHWADKEAPGVAEAVNRLGQAVSRPGQKAQPFSSGSLREGVEGSQRKDSKEDRELCVGD